MTHYFTLVLASQGLGDRNPAAHAIMYVALLLGLLLVVIVGVEIFDWLRERASNRRAGILAAEEKPRTYHLIQPDTELRHRYFSEPPGVSREQRPNEPTRHSG